MSKTWTQIAACEERIQLMKKLLKLEVGMAEIEELGLNINSKFKSLAFKNRIKNGEVVSKEVLKEIMILKLRDEKKYLGELISEQKEMRRMIDSELQKNSRPARRLLKEFREESARTRKECRKKYDDKIEHLKRKYRHNEEEREKNIPSDMEEISELRIFDKNRYEEIELESYDIKIIGDVELEENEMKVLKLHPKFAILPRLQEGGLDVDEEMANAKLRMQISKEMEERKDQNKEMIEEEEEKSEEEKVADLELEARTRQVFDPVEKKYDERRRRATDLKECSRTTLPKPLPANEEAKIEIRKEIHRDIYDRYRRENCDKFGNQKSNLSKEEQKGLKSLEKKVKERKLIVIKTDKSSRFAVCSEEAYKRMGAVHTSKDKLVNREEIIETEKILNSHCVAWAKLWQRVVTIMNIEV